MNISEKILEQAKETCMVDNNGDMTESRICIINHEFQKGFELMKKYPKSVTIFGSARLPEDDVDAQKATEVARRLAELGYAITTGGGHGIMGAAHKGSSMADGDSLGINIQLPFEQTMNEYITDAVDFHHFFSRKVVLSYSAEAYIYFAGGFGTMDELFEILTLKQTKKIPDVPIILVGSEFWNPLEQYFKNTMLGYTQTISPEDLNLYTITDDIDQVINIVKAAPVRAEVSERFSE